MIVAVRLEQRTLEETVALARGCFARMSASRDAIATLAATVGEPRGGTT
jgi:hypothetical protein